MTYILCSCTAQKKEKPIQELDMKMSTTSSMDEQRRIWKENLETFFWNNAHCETLAKDMYLGSIWISIRNMV